MSVKLLAENILTAEDFLSATEQEGKYIGQPVPDSANTGAFRLLSKGDSDGNIADFSYLGTATGDGAGGGTTVIDSILAAFGDDYFIGGSVAITDFLQDTADYTEQDVPGRVAKTDANTITVTDLDQDEEVWVVEDMGAAHFNGDFEFHVNIKCTANAVADDRCAVWAVANTIDTLNDIDVASGDFLAVHWRESGGLEYLILEECNGGVILVDTYNGMVIGTDYYLKIVRDESIGTYGYGTLYCYIYSDSGHTTLVDTLTVTLTEKEDFRYLYWMNSWEEGTPGAAWDGIISNLEIISSETKAITDFAQATGTITIGAFTYQVNTGTAFTLTVAYATRDFRVELITSGDAGDATFKWSHNGGTTWLGRDDPNQATWLNESTIIDNVLAQGTRIEIVQALNGDWVASFSDDADGDKIKAKTSSDNGLTWAAEQSLTAAVYWLFAMTRLRSGRILTFFWSGGLGHAMSYSDDHGSSWSDVISLTISPQCVIELSDGQLLGVYSSGNVVYCVVSSDSGFTWSSAITVANDANSQEGPSVVQAENGDIVCAYTSDEDTVGDEEIKCKISTNGGSTWGSSIDVIDYSTYDMGPPTLLKDISGTLYCATEDITNANKIVFTKSTDNGQIWSTGALLTLHTDAADGTARPKLLLIDGYQVICGYFAPTSSEFKFVRRGIWEAYVANACPCAIEAIEQKLICDVYIIWHGGAGEDGDIWQFEAKYDFAMDNIISDSPSKFWRSEQDNIACRIVIDMGANERLLVDGIGFFNCNVRTLSFQANTTDVWTAPLVDESVSFDLVTGIVDYITGNAVEDDSLLGNYDDHHFKTDNYYLRMTSGTDDGETWKILDNVGGYIFLDTTAAVGIAAADTFVIFQGWTAKAFTNRMPYRFLSIYISAQETAEGYYKIGFTPIGKTVTLDRRWTGGYGNPHVYNVDLLQTPQGGLIPIKHAERYREFELTWPFSENTRKQLVALLDYLDRKNICLIPDDSTDNQGLANCFIECYLVKLIGGLQQTGGFDKRLDIKLRFREIL